MTLATELSAFVRAEDGESVRGLHSEDITFHEPRLPDAVVFPATTAEVARVLAWANERRVPVVPFGAGTSLEGHVIPVAGGISLDLTGLNRILSVRAGDLTATVQAGVTRLQLNARVNEEGLQFPVDPGADATLGGMAATNASGTTTVRYGGMRRNVLALEAVLPDGRVVRTGSRAAKSSAGYDLTSLLVGSEGTLAVITELTLRLYGIPEAVLAARVVFPSVEAACTAAIEAVAMGLLIARVELLDRSAVEMVNAHQGTAYTVGPSLLVELAGNPAAVSEDGAAFAALAAEHGGSELEIEDSVEGRTRLWRARHETAHALMHSAPGRKHRSTDTCVPLSELPASIAVAREALERSDLLGYIIGHVGDGNYHVGLMVDPDDPAEIERAAELNDAIVEDALARGGTCTGEHGIGLGKLAYLEREHGDLLPLMRGIKAAFDPNGIMNPGKVLSTSSAP